MAAFEEARAIGESTWSARFGSTFMFLTGALGLLISAFDRAFVGVGLPLVSVQFNSFSWYVWALSLTLLAEFITMLIWLRLSTRLSLQRCFVAALVLSLLGVSLSGAAQSALWLLLARFVQGVGMGALLPLALVLLSRRGDAGAIERRWFLLGYALALIGGLLLGGLLADRLGWRWLFYGQVPLIVLALATALLSKAPPSTAKHTPIVFSHVLLLMGGSMLLLFGIALPSVIPETNGRLAMVLQLCGLLACVLFVVQQRRSATPLLPIRLLFQTLPLIATLASLLIVSVLGSVVVYSVMFFQEILGYSAFLTALLVASMLGMLIVGCALCLWRAPHARWAMTCTGVVVAVVGLVVLARSAEASNHFGMIAMMLLIGLGLGAALPQLWSIMLPSDPVPQPAPTMLLLSVQQFGLMLCLMVFGTLLANTYRSQLLWAPFNARLSAEIPTEYSSTTLILAQSNDSLSPTVQQALTIATQDIYTISALLLLIVLGSLLLFIGSRQPAPALALSDE